MWGSGPRGNHATWSALLWLPVTSPATYKQIGPFLCWFLGEWVCAHFRTVWVSPTYSPVRLGVSPVIAKPTDFSSESFWGFISQHRNPGLHGLSRSPSHQLLLCRSSSLPSFPSPPLLPVWINVSSLTPWLLDFHTVWFYGSSGYFLFLNLLLSFFWLCEEAKCIHLCLHLGRKSSMRILVRITMVI